MVGPDDDPPLRPPSSPPPLSLSTRRLVPIILSYIIVHHDGGRTIVFIIISFSIFVFFFPPTNYHCTSHYEYMSFSACDSLSLTAGRVSSVCRNISWGTIFFFHPLKCHAVLKSAYFIVTLARANTFRRCETLVSYTVYTYNVQRYDITYTISYIHTYIWN